MLFIICFFFDFLFILDTSIQVSPISVGDSSLLDVIDTVIKSLLLLLLVTKSASLVFILNVKI